MDLESLSDAELEAIAGGNLEALSDSTLEMIAAGGGSSPQSWNLGDATSQFISGAIEGIATLPATIADLNPLDTTSLAKRLYSAGQKQAQGPGSLWETVKAALPDFAYTKATQAAIDPYLAERDPNYRYSRTAGSFVGPGLFGKGLQVIKGAPAAVTTIGKLFAPEASVRRQLATDTAAGLTSEAAADTFGDSPVSRFFGALFGAGATSAVTDTAKAAKSTLRGATPEEVKGTAAKVVQETSGMAPQDIEAAILAAPQDRLGNLMTTAEVTKNPGFAQLEQTMTTTGDGANRLGALRDQRAELRDEILEGMTTAPPATKEAIGTNLMQKAAGVEKQMGESAKQAWARVPREVVIDVTPERMELSQLLLRRQKGLDVNSKVEKLVGQFMDDTEPLMSGGLQDIRSDALMLGRDANVTPYETEILAALSSLIDNAMGRGFGESLDPKSYAMWKLARDKTSAKAETFKRGTAGGALTEDMARPSEAPKNAFKGDKRSIEELRSAVGNDPEMMESFKRFILDDIPRDAQEQLTPHKLRNYLRRNEGGLTDLFEPQHYSNMTRILEDLQSEASVSRRANASSKGQAVTQQRLTVAGAIEEQITSGITGKSSFLGKIIQALKEGAGIKDKAAVRAMLTDAVFDPEFALELSKAPTRVRILKGMERLKEALDNGIISAGRSGLLSNDARDSKRQGLFASPAPAVRTLNGPGSQSGKSQKAPLATEQPTKRSSTGDFSIIPAAYGDTFDSEVSPTVYRNSNPTQAAFNVLRENSGGLDMAGDIDIDSLVKAVIHQESRGRADAVSPKGATGIMQIMPATAREIADELGLDTYDLRDPATNQLMGTYYLRKMLDKFGSPELALAAYNAGPARVQGWIDKYGPSWADISQSLSKIRAYEETRNYVPQVLARLNALNDVVEV